MGDHAGCDSPTHTYPLGTTGCRLDWPCGRVLMVYISSSTRAFPEQIAAWHDMAIYGGCPHTNLTPPEQMPGDIDRTVICLECDKVLAASR